MNENYLHELLDNLHEHSESEVLELKEAKKDFSFKDLGRYFSALSNEVNLRGQQSGLLIFGVTDKGTVCGTAYRQESHRPSKGLQSLKREIAQCTNNRITFRNIYEIDHDGKRVVIFEIPSATRGIPTQWNGAVWAREDESLVPLPMDKIDEIRNQPAQDWSREIISDASFSDLDPEAVFRVRQKVRERYGERESLIDHLSDVELLDKMGITLRGSITRTALLLLGSSEAARLMEGTLPKITWSLYGTDDSVRTYNHFGPPFLITIDDILAKIRNEETRILADPASLAPTSMSEYDAWSLRELIGNAIAHQDYSRGGKINVEEFSDRIVFMNEGSFIPGTLEKALQVGYKPPYYRNPFLADAMLNIGMLDQNAMGIRTICETAQQRCMSLPTYDLTDPNRVNVVLLNHEIDPAYTHILFEHPKLDILAVLALDKVQKKMPLSRQQQDMLLERGFAKRASDEMWQLIEPEPRAFLPQYEINAEATMTEYDEKQQVLEAMPIGQWLSRNEITGSINERLNKQGKSIDGFKVYQALKDLERLGNVKSQGIRRGKQWLHIS